MAESNHVIRGGEATRMSGYPVHHPGVFVVNSASNNLMPEGGIVFRRRYKRAMGLLHGVESDKHSAGEKGTKNLSLAKGIEWFLRDSFQRHAQQNKTDIAVLCTSSGIGDKRNVKRLSQ